MHVLYGDHAPFDRDRDRIGAAGDDDRFFLTDFS
jgi:hypothetical protein